MDWKKILHWTPRILTIALTLFLAIFALDVFGEYAFPMILVALFMHLIPNFVLIGILVIAWKWPRIGGASFLILGIVFTIFFNTYREIISFLLVSAPVFLLGILFMLDWYLNKK